MLKCSKLSLFEGQQMTTIASSDFSCFNACHFCALYRITTYLSTYLPYGRLAYSLQSPSKRFTLGFENSAWTFCEWLNSSLSAGRAVGRTVPPNLKYGQTFLRDAVHVPLWGLGLPSQFVAVVGAMNFVIREPVERDRVRPNPLCSFSDIQYPKQPKSPAIFLPTISVLYHIRPLGSPNILQHLLFLILADFQPVLNYNVI